MDNVENADVWPQAQTTHGPYLDQKGVLCVCAELCVWAGVGIAAQGGGLSQPGMAWQHPF